jgi:N-glycosylase/DNA lyase
MIWHDVRSIQDDVKALMAQSNIDKTNISNVEKRVSNLEQVVFFSKVQKVASDNSKPELIFSKINAVLNKEEEEKKSSNF